METQTKVLIAIGLIIVAVIGFSLTQGDSPEAVTNSTVDEINLESMDESEEAMINGVDEEMEGAMESAEEKMMKDEAMSDKEMMDEVEPTAQAVTAGSYLAYSPEAVANSKADNILLTFSASWCPSCRTLDKNINENLSSIPAGTQIYKVDYDTNVALRQEYGVTMQHTHVLVDSDGAMIKKWTGGNTLNELVAGI